MPVSNTSYTVDHQKQKSVLRLSPGYWGGYGRRDWHFRISLTVCSQHWLTVLLQLMLMLLGSVGFS